jgi:hypothetical protein
VFGIVGFFLFIMYVTRFTEKDYKKAAIPVDDVCDENENEDPVNNAGAKVKVEEKVNCVSDSESSSSSSSSSSRSSVVFPTRADLVQIAEDSQNKNESDEKHSNTSENPNKLMAIDHNVNINNDENKQDVAKGKLETDRKVKEIEKETNSSFSISSYLSSISLNNLPVEQKTALKVENPEIIDIKALHSFDHRSPSPVLLPPTPKNEEKVVASPHSDGSDSSSDSHNSICSSPLKPKNIHDVIERGDEQLSDISSASSVLGLLFQDFDDDGEIDDDEY